MYCTSVQLRQNLLKAIYKVKCLLIDHVFSLKRLILICLGQIIQGLDKSYKAWTNRTRPGQIVLALQRVQYISYRALANHTSLGQIAQGLDKLYKPWTNRTCPTERSVHFLQSSGKSHKPWTNRTSLRQIAQALDKLQAIKKIDFMI